MQTELFSQVRGDGEPVLLIAGTPGDGGQFDAVADVLARDHTVITYDRRGTSRSAGAASKGWTTTVAEQADDAATVLDATAGGKPAIVYGTSNGAAVALELVLRHPERVAHVVLHEMPLMSVLADPAAVAEMLGSIIGPAMEAGGPWGALEAFLRFAFGDAVYEGMTPALRDRLLTNAPMVFEVELPAFQPYRPDERSLKAVKVPVMVLVGVDQQAPFFAEAAAWLADRLDTTVERSPGAHGPQFSCPDDLAAIIRAL